MASPQQRISEALGRARHRHPLLDHAIRTQEHYGAVNAGNQAGGITYYAFLSFFPLLALAFFVVGYVARVYPLARDNLVTAIQSVLPGIVGPDPGEISLSAVQSSAAAAGILGVLGLAYAGLGWVGALRTALLVVFDEQRDQPNFFVGKLRDVVTLVVIGLVMVLSVAISGLVTGYSGQFLDLVGLGRGATPLLALLGVVLGVGADMVLFFALFRLLAVPPTRSRDLWSGALLGALGFEALKWLSSWLLGTTKSQPAFQAFGIALILVVWINYFSRVVLYAASWAHTSTREPARPLVSPFPIALSPTPLEPAARPARPEPAEPSAGTWFAAGAGAMLALVALVRRRRR